MFAIIADDLTGAAELAGIALKYGVKPEIKSDKVDATQADLLIINTSSRGLKGDQAFSKVEKACEQLIALNPEWIYKKTDSVFRGNILAEIVAILNVMDLKKCLLIPANPGLNRTIENRKYMINNLQITETSFAQDPDYPCTTADVLGMLGKFGKYETGYLTENQKLPAKGVFVPEIKNDNSLNYWSEQVDSNLLPAGAAEFFEKILQKKGYQKSNMLQFNIAENDNILFVCGSSHQNSRLAIKKAANKGFVISYMPQEIIYQPNDLILEKWATDICEYYKKNSRVVLAVLQKAKYSKTHSLTIQTNFGQVCQKILFKIKLDTLAIEGGETAQEITKRLNINSFYPDSLLAPGVVGLKTKTRNPATVIIKPGSYLWPEQLWRFN